MPFFFARLQPMRPDFPANLSESERAVMGAHSAFLAEQLRSGALVVAGPVLSSSGTFGMGVFEAASLESVREIIQRDPANGVGTYEIFPMAAGVARPRP